MSISGKLLYGGQVRKARKLLQLELTDLSVLTGWTIEFLEKVERWPGDKPAFIRHRTPAERTTSVEPFEAFEWLFNRFGVSFGGNGPLSVEIKDRVKGVAPAVFAQRCVRRARRAMWNEFYVHEALRVRWAGGKMRDRSALLLEFDIFRGERSVRSVIGEFVATHQGRHDLRFSRRSLEQWLSTRRKFGEAALGDHDAGGGQAPRVFEEAAIKALIAELAFGPLKLKPQAIADEVCRRFPKIGFSPSAAGVRRAIDKMKSRGETSPHPGTRR